MGAGVGCRDGSLVLFSLGVSVSSHEIAGDGSGNLSGRFRIVDLPLCIPCWVACFWT